MKRKIFWLVVSFLMVAALLVASCAAEVEEEEEVVTPEEEEVVTPEEEEVEEVAPAAEKPEYGGVFVNTLSSGPQVFDEASGHRSRGPTLVLTNEELLVGDWAKGPAGTGEASWLYDMIPASDVTTGQLAESWELTDPQTLTFHIRKGVHWHDKPPVNGREMTADDVVFTFVRLWDAPQSYLGASFPWKKYLADEPAKAITAPDKWTVVFKAAPGWTGEVYVMVANYTFIVAPEVVEEYGGYDDWKNACGTGPFMLVDHVADSSCTFVRNPNYWGKHPLYPQDTMPYLDGVKYLVIPDNSTRISALRTGKIDWLGLGWEDAEDVLETNPELNYLKFNPGIGFAIHFRVDKPESPLYDNMVRRALCMAVDNQEIADTLWGGEAEILNWPIAAIKEWMDIYTPLDEQPESLREEFGYYPEKAKQLLAEAGYPDGFKTEIYTTSGGVDLLSAVKAYWEDIGVELDIQVRESAVYNAIMYGKRYEEMIIGAMLGYAPDRPAHVQPGNFYNYSMIDDPHINELYEAMVEDWFNEPVKRQRIKELSEYALQTHCIMLQLPIANTFTFWQPWVKGYHGELQLGKWKVHDFPKYIWLDVDLMKEMTGRK